MGLRPEYAQKYVNCLEMRRSQLVALLHRTGFSWQDAEDAAQEAIIEALALIEAEVVEDIQNRWAWLIAVARNKARDIGRRRKLWRPLDVDAVALEAFAVCEDEEDVQLALARVAFCRLPHCLQDIFAYVYLEGNSYSEAAKHFQLGLGVVSRRLRETSDRLRSELDVFPEFRARAERYRGRATGKFRHGDDSNTKGPFHDRA